jgi:mRNA export factor
MHIFKHKAPVLCSAFSKDGQHVFTGSCDKTAQMWNLPKGVGTQVGMHDAPIKEIGFLPDKKMVVTGSWDKTIKYWDCRAQAPALTVSLPERVYAMSCTEPLLVCATAGKQILIYNLSNPKQPFRTYDSPLKMQSRCLANFVDRAGFALGSIEGRVAIQYVDEKQQSKNFAFKCHRVDNNVYAVNGIAFHPCGKFATYGSDGVYTFWDKDSKQRLKQFTANPQPITSGTFNNAGNIFAYSVGYDWSRGVQYYDKSKMNTIFLHNVTKAEMHLQ